MTLNMRSLTEENGLSKQSTAKDWSADTPPQALFPMGDLPSPILIIQIVALNLQKSQGLGLKSRLLTA